MAQTLLVVMPRIKKHLLLLIVWLVADIPVCKAQFNPSFDSAYRAAIVLPDAGTRLTQLRPLIEQSYASSVFQTIAFGKAFLDAAAELKSDTDLYEAHTILKTGYERNRDYERSVRHGLKAVAIAGERKDYSKQIQAFLGIGFTYASMSLMSGNKGDMEKALYYCNQALQLSKAKQIKEEEPYIFGTTADVYAMNKYYDTAISLYQRAIKSREEQGKKGTQSTYSNLGIALNLKGNYNAALAAYAMADSMGNGQPNGDYFKLKIASNRAILFGDMGRFSESEQLAKEILTKAQQTGGMDMQVDMVEHLKNLYKKQERYAEALIYADSLAAIKQRMLNEERTSQVAEMQARYDAGVKDQQIAGQQQTITRNRQQSIILWIGILLLFMAGTASFIGMRRSRRLARKVTAQQAVLLNQQAELQRINTMKDQLFSLISHDLRMPLNSLSAYANLLEYLGELSPEKAKQYSTDLRQTLSYTAGLMENLLQFAKTQMQAPQPYAEMISLDAIVDSTISVLQPALSQKSIQIIRNFEVDTTAYADEDMTELILRNLLANAIKFSKRDNSIVISVKAIDADWIMCSVQDNGVGMPPELTAVWNGDSVPTPVRSTIGTQHEKGAGLGLMLSKTFAGLMNGRLQAESTEGEGAKFSLLLPRQKSAASF